MWRFLGIWSKNRYEWVIGLIGCMYYNITTVGFFDAMGEGQVDFILNQTEMRTILCSGQYLDKVKAMKEKGLAGHVKNLIMIDDVLDSQVKEASDLGITVYTLQQVMDAGEKGAADAPAFADPKPDDKYIFSYTSGTTGDSKGVKLSH